MGVNVNHRILCWLSGMLIILVLRIPSIPIAADPPPTQPGQVDAWPLVLPTPQRVQYGEVVPIAGWKYTAPAFSADLNAEIREVCGVSLATGVPLHIEIPVTRAKHYDLYSGHSSFSPWEASSPSGQAAKAFRMLLSADGEFPASAQGSRRTIGLHPATLLAKEDRPIAVQLSAIPEPPPGGSAQQYRLSITSVTANLSAYNETGIYYALQSLRALQYQKSGMRHVRKVEIHDWPVFENRGMIMAPGRSTRSSRIKMNLLQYAWAKGELTTQSRNFYMAEVNNCKRRFVRFMSFQGYQGYFNGKLLTYDEAGFQMLRELFTDRFNMGAREFMAAFDDMSLPAGKGTEWGTNHANAVKVVYDTVKALDPRCKVYFVPVPYGGTPERGFVFSGKDDAIAYLKKADEILPKEVEIVWTGRHVFSATVDNADADSYAGAIGRKPFMWDNDMLTWAGQMQPLSGRPADYSEHVLGWVGNWMDGIPTMRLAFFPVEISAADYLWNPRAYDKGAALERAYQFVGGEKAAEVKQLWERIREARPPTNKKIPKAEADSLTAAVQGAADQEVVNDLVAYMQSYVVQ